MQFSADTIKKILNWLRTSCVVTGFHNNSSDLTHTTVNFWADFKQRIIDKAINEQKNGCGPVSRLKDCTSNLLVVTFDTAHCSDRNTVCLKDLTFLFIPNWSINVE